MTNEPGLSPAELAIIALGATEPDSVSIPLGFSLDDSPTVLTVDRVVAALAGLKKPVTCSANLQGSVLVIRCEQHRDMSHEAAAAHTHVTDVAVVALGAARSLRLQVDKIVFQVRVTGRTSHFVVKQLLALENFAAWRRDYEIASLTLTMSSADERAQASGATAVLALSGPLSFVSPAGDYLSRVAQRPRTLLFGRIALLPLPLPDASERPAEPGS